MFYAVFYSRNSLYIDWSLGPGKVLLSLYISVLKKFKGSSQQIFDGIKEAFYFIWTSVLEFLLSSFKYKVNGLRFTFTYHKIDEYQDFHHLYFMVIKQNGKTFSDGHIFCNCYTDFSET